MDLTSPSEKYYEVHEVYYEENKPILYTANPVTLTGCSQKEITKIAKMVISDLRTFAPLKESELPSSEQEFLHED
jgi:hypothetical protein